MKKVRKRLQREEKEAKGAAQSKGATDGNPRHSAAQSEGPKESARRERERKPRPPRPERKGKKPFVPPTGRNAGKALGGNYIGKRRHEIEIADSQDEVLPHNPDSGPEHPLGLDVREED
jgi:hypothetical protein